MGSDLFRPDPYFHQQYHYHHHQSTLSLPKEPNQSTMAAFVSVIKILLVLLSAFVVCVSSINSSSTTNNYLRIKQQQKKQKSLSLIQKLNREGPYLGVITVYTPEEEAFFASKVFQPHPKYPFLDLSGRRFHVGKIRSKKVIYVKCGIGTMNAAATTQQMADMFDISGFIHFGIAGNTNSTLSIGDVTIPKQFAHTGQWDWVNPDKTVSKNDVAHLDFESFNVPNNGEEINTLGLIGYGTEQLYSESGQPGVPQNVFWFETTRDWFHLAANLEGMKLQKCLNSSFCLPNEPKVVIGLRAATANDFVDNAAYRDFLFQTFGVSSTDMESVAIVMTSLSNDIPSIVIRALSDLAGEQEGPNPIRIYGTLAASNAIKAVVRFIEILPAAYVSRV